MTQALHETINACYLCGQGEIEIILGSVEKSKSMRENLDGYVSAILKQERQNFRCVFY